MIRKRVLLSSTPHISSRQKGQSFPAPEIPQFQTKKPLVQHQKSSAQHTPSVQHQKTLNSTPKTLSSTHPLSSTPKNPRFHTKNPQLNTSISSTPKNPQLNTPLSSTHPSVPHRKPLRTEGYSKVFWFFAGISFSICKCLIMKRYLQNV